MNKKEVKDREYDVSYDLDGKSVAEAIKFLQDYLTRVNHTRAEFRFEQYYESSYLYIDVYRLETDNEYKKRMEKNRKARERKKKTDARKRDQELIQLEKLKKKYPDSA